jgi:hypothetical protein
MVAVAAVAFFEALINTYVWSKVGGPALVFRDGTDHAGWAWTADWLSEHPILDSPPGPWEANGDAYPSKPWGHFVGDPRFGTFVFLSLLSLLRHLSGFFTYDLACAVGLAVGVLGVIGAFTRTVVLSVLLGIGLLTCHWFEYGQTGYLGKLIAYPAMFTANGLVFATLRTNPNARAFQLGALTLLLIALSQMYAGPVLGVFTGLLGTTFVLAKLLLSLPSVQEMERRELLKQSAQEIGFLCVVALLCIAASGILARPLVMLFPNYHVPWSYVLPRIAEIEHQGLGLTGFTDVQIDTLTVAIGAFWVFGLIAAVWVRSPEAMALIGGPMILLFVLLVLNLPDIAFQLIGAFFPLAMIGYASASENPLTSRINLQWGKTNVVLAALLFFSIITHLPRFIGSIGRYDGNQIPLQLIFEKSQMDELAAAIGHSPTMIDLYDYPQFSLAALVELGRHFKFDWSEKAWRTFFGCNSPASLCPPYLPPSIPPTYRLVSTIFTPSPPTDKIVFRTNQYLLLRE